MLRRLRRAGLVFGLVLHFVAGGPVSAQDFFAGAGEGDNPFDITADTVELDSDRDVYIARGNVKIVQPGRTLNADWVMFSNTTRQGVATGNVELLEGDDKLYGEVLHFEVDDLKGVVLKGTLLADGGFIVHGETMRKVGTELYEIDQTKFTTCRCKPGETEPWVISAKRADIEFGGYATTRNSTFDVFGIPILWTPWMRYPIKNERESGFLFPEFNTATRDGFSVGLPFFWAVHDQVGITLTPYWTEDHGFKGNAEIEYVYGRESYGNLFGSIVPSDDSVEENDSDTPFDDQRWTVEWIHDHRFEDGPFADQLPGRDWRFVSDARALSDNLYAFDFRDFSNLRSNRYIESSMFVEGYHGENREFALSIAGHYGDDIQNPDDQDRDDFLLQRAPDIRLSMTPKPIPFVEENGRFGSFFSFDARYTHFWAFDDVEDVYGDASRVVDDQIFADTGIDAIPDGFERNSSGAIVRLDGTIENADGTITSVEELLAADAMLEEPLLTDPMALAAAISPDGSMDNFPPGPEGDGRFQEGEPLADRGHRVVLNPRLHFPFRVADTVEVMPELGWLGFLYSTDGQSSETNNYLTAHLDVRSRLRSVIELPFGIGRAVHLLEPRFEWAAIFGDEDEDLPLFVPRPFVAQERVRQLELSAALRDPSDRIREMNVLALSVGNRIYVPGNVVEVEVEEGVTETVQRPPRLWAEFTASLAHDFDNDDFRNFYFDGTAYPFENVRTRFNLGYDFDENEISEGLFQVGYGTPQGNDFSIAYRYVTDIPRFFENFGDSERFEEFEEGFLKVNQVDIFTRIAVTRNWAFTYNFQYSFENSLTLRNQFGVEYVSKCYCWAARIEAAEERAGGFEINFRYRIIGLGDDTVRPFSRRRSGARDPLIDNEPFVRDPSGSL